MSMFTRCPHCDTVFRVTPQQLQVSSGQVRCGRCQEVFDAFSTLTSRLPGGRMEDAAVAAARLEQSLRRERHEPAVPADESLPAGVLTAREPAPPSPVRAAASALAPPAPAASASASPAPASVPEPEILALPPELFGVAAGAPGHRPAWVLACLLGVLALAAQAAWFFPGEMAVRLPTLRPLLVQYCGWAGCRVELPRMPDLLFIEASDLQLLDPAHPNEVLLTATVRNRAAFQQALPMLELTLTDNANRTAARKVFRPAEYLGTSLGPDEGIGAGQEVSVRLYLDTGDLKAAGYRLYLFFA
jgi:predicted Zn finger-like uncharacterized protein